MHAGHVHVMRNEFFTENKFSSQLSLQIVARSRRSTFRKSSTITNGSHTEKEKMLRPSMKHFVFFPKIIFFICLFFCLGASIQREIMYSNKFLKEPIFHIDRLKMSILLIKKNIKAQMTKSITKIWLNYWY